ncbi:acetyl-CoA C-acetyltransferase [Candidatus Caldarchaeum subterraneum]|uniref:Acetyl-CoA C-acetyltransferase n=1 Tax=Caldiarchaeum subterraneum TaxID=311458 RepID=E6N826_CALS0|nr:acetyl-CoA C-acetyltransferase [Candidatus Caldarchaeum subterraneum]BAJ51205.1 acetyl-CoA C-acetyltransferase [Candidatus Caldarchaeum subterraneum]
MTEVYVAGVGEIPCKPSYTQDFREMLFKAFKNCLEDSESEVSEIDAVVASGLDFFEGISITDSYTPDQVGGRLKFNTLVSNDSLNAFIHAYMLIKTGWFKNVLVTAYAKSSNILNYGEILLNTWDPHLIRPLLIHHFSIAALDAQAFLSRRNGEPRDLSIVAAKNIRNALRNSAAAYGADTDIEKIESEEFVSEPLRRSHVARLCDYASVVLLSSDNRSAKAVVKGVGFAHGSHSSDLSERVFGKFAWVRPAVSKALPGSLRRVVEFVEVSESFASTELMVLDELGVYDGDVLKGVRGGDFMFDGALPVNPSGGCIGMGYPLNAAGLQRVVQAVKLLRMGRWSGCLVASVDGEVVDGGSVVVLSAG